MTPFWYGIVMHSAAIVRSIKTKLYVAPRTHSESELDANYFVFEYLA